MKEEAWGINGKGGGSLTADAADDDVEGFEEDGAVEDEGGVGDVVEVEGEFGGGVLDILAVGVIDLGPAGEAWFGEVAEVVGGQFVFVFGDAERPFGAGADEAHFAAEDVVQLGDFVDAALAEEAAEAGDAGVVGGGGAAFAFGVEAHGAELADGEFATAEPDAGLAEEGGAWAVEADGEPDEGAEGSGEGEAGGGDREVEEAFKLPEGGGLEVEEVAIEEPLSGVIGEVEEAEALTPERLPGVDGHAGGVEGGEDGGEGGEAVGGVGAEDEGGGGEAGGGAIEGVVGVELGFEGRAVEVGGVEADEAEAAAGELEAGFEPLAGGFIAEEDEAERGAFEAAAEEVAPGGDAEAGEDHGGAHEEEAAGLAGQAVAPEEGDAAGADDGGSEAGDEGFGGKAERDEVGIAVVGADEPGGEQRDGAGDEEDAGVGEGGAVTDDDEEREAGGEGEGPEGDVGHEPRERAHRPVAVVRGVGRVTRLRSPGGRPRLQHRAVAGAGRSRVRGRGDVHEGNEKSWGRWAEAEAKAVTRLTIRCRRTPVRISAWTMPKSLEFGQQKSDCCRMADGGMAERA